MRSGFRKLGNSLRGLAYKGTIFDSDVKLCAKEDEADNFDILLATAEKIAILRPILPPQVSDHLVKKMQDQRTDVINETICCFYLSIRLKRQIL